MRRIPQEEIDARHQRIKRAMDVSLKKSYLPKHVQDLQTPYAGYLSVRTWPLDQYCPCPQAVAETMSRFGPMCSCWSHGSIE